MQIIIITPIIQAAINAGEAATNTGVFIESSVVLDVSFFCVCADDNTFDFSIYSKLGDGV